MKELLTREQIKEYFEGALLADTETKREIIKTIKAHNFSTFWIMGLFEGHDKFFDIAMRLSSVADSMIDELRDGVNA